MMERPDSTPDLESIGVPALVLVGSEDVITPVADAVATMAERQVGAVLLMSEDDLVAGIFSERDLLVRVVHAGLDPQTTISGRGSWPISRVSSGNSCSNRGSASRRRLRTTNSVCASTV